ncbi:copper homeostasis protein CutC [Dyella solisilvae]|uniref:PF03932 family protein CutC n=1 Tax=Dyella solisilvae TaxID=1920168 RepID=A0A370K368_9GAMM|nr:copper homeostasis protein CutC [Dyella solisilvae]RDI97113.1 copper homeostasis protein CutC [Dyella solisilvae]
MAARLLEVAANSLASALAAQAGGAGRVELCTALELGGLTPSHGEIALVRERVRLPLYVLIRPRAGDFLYSEQELETMHRDIEACAAFGCDGVVLGVLDAQGNVDRRHGRALVDAAGGMGVTFHRAFDLAPDPLSALDDVMALGVERLLTSGGQRTAMGGAAQIRSLIERAAGRMTVMPGSGIHSDDIAALARQTGAHEFHASAKRVLASRMPYYGDGLGMDGGEIRTDEAQVRALVEALSRE